MWKVTRALWHRVIVCRGCQFFVNIPTENPTSVHRKQELSFFFFFFNRKVEWEGKQCWFLGEVVLEVQFALGTIMGSSTEHVLYIQHNRNHFHSSEETAVQRQDTESQSSGNFWIVFFSSSRANWKSLHVGKLSRVGLIYIWPRWFPFALAGLAYLVPFIYSINSH